MRVFHTTSCEAIANDNGLARLATGLARLRGLAPGAVGFEEMEAQVHALFVAAERDVLGAELERLDVDVPHLVLDGQVHGRVLRSAMVYTSAAGPVRVVRTLYAVARSGRSRH